MKTILVPIDFSSNATNAMHYASYLASQNGSKLILMHAIKPEVIEIPGNPFILKADTRLEPYYLEKLQTLAKQIRLQTGSKLEVETVCVPGPFPEHVNELVYCKQVDLVIMGNKGAHNLVEKLFGTNTAGFIKQAVCPVLTVPADVRYQQIKNIAYASDFEREDTIFLKQLVPFAELFGAAISIFNIKSEDQLNLVSDQQVLQSIKKHFPNKTFSFAQLKENNVTAGIEAFVQENKMDLLAIPVYPPDILEKVFHTSVSQRLAYHNRIPFLALPLKTKTVKNTSTKEHRTSQGAH